MPDPPRGNWAEALAVRQQRLDLYARVLDVQKAFYEQWGRWPTVAEVAHAIDGT